MLAQVAVIALTLGLSQVQGSGADLPPEMVYGRAAPSVAKVVTKTLNGMSASGSGFLFAPNRLATCWHVVSDAKSVTVQFPGGEPIVAKVVDASAESDYAILAVSTKQPFLRLRSDQPKPGERLYAVGAPLGLSGSIVDGLMSQARTIDSAEVYQISTPITFGNSGGPVLDSRARVVGMASSGINGIQSISFAVPAKTLASAHIGNTPLDFDIFREERLSGWYSLIDRPIEGDEMLSKGRSEEMHSSGPEKGRHIVSSTTLTKIVQANDQEVIREHTDLEVSIERDGIPLAGRAEKYQRSAVRVTSDLFGVPKGLRQALESLDSSDAVAARLVFDFLPESIGCLIKVGKEWTIDFPARGKVPPGKYNARFVGFEIIKGVRCARIESVFEQTVLGERHKTERTRWLARGSSAIRSVYKVTAEGITATGEREVVYWKFGPEQLRKKPSDMP